VPLDAVEHWIDGPKVTLDELHDALAWADARWRHEDPHEDPQGRLL
jgi:hypothetical protein